MNFFNLLTILDLFQLKQKNDQNLKYKLIFKKDANYQSYILSYIQINNQNIFLQKPNNQIAIYKMLAQIGHAICSDKFKFVIAPIVVGVATSGLVFQNLYFFPTWQEQNQVLARTVSIILYTMCFISFYKAIVIKNSPPSNLNKPRLKKLLRNNHPFYTESNQCAKESNKYKPPRTSHCNMCKCVVRMDHHCPYINNCVGLKNFKAFILFTGYGGLFALQFLVSSIKFYFDLRAEKIQPLSEGVITVWLFLSFVSFLLALSMLGLSLSNIVMASRNITQLQMMKGHFRFTDKHGLHPNPYDLGFFTNLNTVFDSDKWSFWLPSQIITENDGTEYRMIPQVRQEQIKKLPANVRQDIKSMSQKLIPNTIQQLREKQSKNYADTIFFYLGKQYRLGNKQQLKSDNLMEQLVIKTKTTSPTKKQPKDEQEEYQKQLQRRAYEQLREIMPIDITSEKSSQLLQQQECSNALKQIYGQDLIENDEDSSQPEQNGLENDKQSKQPTKDRVEQSEEEQDYQQISEQENPTTPSN